jgi:hypothetical protein
MSRLFLRHKEADAYERVGDPADDISFEAPVTCDKKPVVLFNTVKWAGGGGNPDGVYRFDLRTKELTMCIAKDALNVPGTRGRSWIMTLVSLADDAQALYLKVGIEKPASGSGIVEYYLARLALLDNKLELLSQLQDIRF